MISIVWNKAEKFCIDKLFRCRGGLKSHILFVPGKKNWSLWLPWDCCHTCTHAPIHTAIKEQSPCDHTSMDLRGTMGEFTHSSICAVCSSVHFYCTFYKMVTGSSFRYINGCSFARCSERTAAKGAGQERPINRLDYLTSSVTKVTNRSIVWFVEKASKTLLTLTTQLCFTKVKKKHKSSNKLEKYIQQKRDKITYILRSHCKYLLYITE